MLKDIYEFSLFARMQGHAGTELKRLPATVSIDLKGFFHVERSPDRASDHLRGLCELRSEITHAVAKRS
jgi:hypothetical protein